MPLSSATASPGEDKDQAMDLSWEGEIQQQLVRDLYHRSRLAIVTMLVLTGVIGWAIAPAFQADARVRLAQMKPSVYGEPGTRLAPPASA